MTESTQPQVVMALFDSELRDEMFLLLELCEIKNYTHFVGLHGSSASGKKEGTVAWPGTNEVFLLLLSESEVQTFQKSIKEFKQQRKKAPGLITFNWNLSGIT